ncbi:MAG: RNA-binding transcriptional accessory protein [Clostridiales bacterium]|nr:RNA-binding transcriptional accessory protein [Clostridiales bacterium]
MDIIKKLCDEFNLKQTQTENTVKLIDEGNTIPFIARYRKELTGSLDDQIIRELYDRLMSLRNLDEKRESVRKLIDEQGKLTEEIESALDKAETVTEIDDIYRPYRPKRRTRASIAKEKGLEGLSAFILLQNADKPLEVYAEEYVSEEKEVKSAAEALNGAKDIIAEMISDNADYRAAIRELTEKKGVIVSTAADSEEKSVYENYYDFTEPVSKIAGHRILAINRGEKEGFLKVSIEAPAEEILGYLENQIIASENTYTTPVLKETAEDAYKRLIEPSIEREIRNLMTERASEGAMKVFDANLRQLLLQPPIKDKVVMALDPGYRTGCKTAVVDGTGKVLSTGVIYCTKPHSESKIAASRKIVKEKIEKYNVDIVAIGNGTASRETETFAADIIKEIGRKDLCYAIVNEAGASVYSASKLGAQEFPDFDVSIRSAVSLARRLQDPLAELVKIDPKSIGVGQYQHDMDKKRLDECLGGVVESCVNSVGADLNTASPSLLSYVAGISSAVAKNIIAYREENGKFKNRKELLKVKKLGPKAFEQCAGFLRITDGDEILDNTGVHPESYGAAREILKKISASDDDIRHNKVKNIHKLINVSRTARELEIGEPTLRDILSELEKPGRDPRDDMPKPILKSDVLTMDDLKEGMVLKGTVRNVIDFGCFVDIGVHQDGLVHISQISNKYIKHPLEAVKLGDIIDVKVLSVDKEKGRISLTMKI